MLGRLPVGANAEDCRELREKRNVAPPRSMCRLAAPECRATLFQSSREDSCIVFQRRAPMVPCLEGDE